MSNILVKSTATVRLLHIWTHVTLLPNSDILVNFNTKHPFSEMVVINWKKNPYNPEIGNKRRLLLIQKVLYQLWTKWNSCITRILVSIKHKWTLRRLSLSICQFCNSVFSSYHVMYTKTYLAGYLLKQLWWEFWHVLSNCDKCL